MKAEPGPGLYNTRQNATLEQWALLKPLPTKRSWNMECHRRQTEIQPHTSAGIQQGWCNCCHRWTNTRQNNNKTTKSFLCQPLAQTFLENLRRTPDLSALKSYFGFSFWEASPKRARNGGLWARTRWAQGNIRVVVPTQGTHLSRTGPILQPQPAAGSCSIENSTYALL